MSEVRSQMAAGAELAGMLNAGFLVAGGNQGLMDEQEQAVATRNLQEAIRCFETALLLDPTNRQAKMSLAWCQREWPIGQIAEAREYYRQIIEEGVKDRWLNQAQTALDFSALRRWESAEARRQWWAQALQQSTNADAREFFRRKAAEAERDAVIQNGEGSKTQSLAEERLLETLQRFDTHKWYSAAMGMDDFVKSYGTNRAAAVQRLGELLPRMKAAASNSISFLLATLVTYQEDTNAPVVAEFEKTFDWCAEHPKEVQDPYFPFWSHVRYTAFDWALEHKAYGLSLKIIEAKIRVTAETNKGLNVDEDDDKMSLAYTYMLLQRWKDALKVFESWTNQPVRMPVSGPWGKGPTVVRTSKAANYCRKQLGLPEVHDPREFELENTGICFCGNGGGTIWLTKFGTFAAAADGLWIANTGRLLALDFDLRTNLVINLPVSDSIPITTVCLGSSNIWIATGGAGLIEYDKTSHQCHLLTEKEGLLMDYISSLELTGDVLWIGYGEESTGGLGRLEWPSRRVTSFAVSLADSRKAGGKTSRNPVVSLAAAKDGEVWVVAKDQGLLRYRSSDNSWESVQNLEGTGSVLSDHGRLFAGNFFSRDKPKGGLGINTLASTDGTWRRFPAVEGLPKERVTTLSVDGANLWVGGMGYVALVDPARDKVLKFSYIKSDNVDKIQVGGGWVWAQFDWHLYKARLNNP
jgi:tetratricopeptide (TPR) repeat protein